MAKPVFKFCSAKGAAAILEKNSIFITSPLDLNDAFEMRPAWTKDHEERRYQNDLARNEAISGSQGLFATRQGPVPVDGNVQHLPASPPMDVELQLGIADIHNERAFRDLHTRFRVLSLVSSLFDLDAKGGESAEQQSLMWSHYADQFQGICLALDPAKFNNGIQQGGFRVNYLPERKFLPPSYYDCWLALDAERLAVPGFELNAESELLLPPVLNEERLRQQFLDILTHKSPAWAYEREVRMIYERGQADYSRIQSQCPECKEQGRTFAECKNPCYRDAIALPSGAILAVIFGTDCLSDSVDSVLSILDHPRYQHVDLYWSCLHSSRYGVLYTKRDQHFIRDMQKHRTKQFARSKGHVRKGENDKLETLLTRKGVNYELPRR